MYPRIMINFRNCRSICVTNSGVRHARARFTSQELDYVGRALGAEVVTRHTFAGKVSKASDSFGDVGTSRGAWRKIKDHTEP